MSDLRAMLDGCRADPKNALRHLILADYIDDHVGDGDWSALIRLSVEFPPAYNDIHPELWAAFARIAERHGFWPSPDATGNLLFMWTGNPYFSPEAVPAYAWSYGVLQPNMYHLAESEPWEVMQPGFVDSCGVGGDADAGPSPPSKPLT